MTRYPYPRSNLTGQRYKQLEIISYVDSAPKSNGHPESRWLCRCDCGREFIAFQSKISIKAGVYRWWACPECMKIECVCCGVRFLPRRATRHCGAVKCKRKWVRQYQGKAD